MPMTQRCTDLEYVGLTGNLIKVQIQMVVQCSLMFWISYKLRLFWECCSADHTLRSKVLSLIGYLLERTKGKRGTYLNMWLECLLFCLVICFSSPTNSRNNKTLPSFLPSLLPSFLHPIRPSFLSPVHSSYYPFTLPSSICPSIQDIAVASSMKKALL
jgi:hypothetical protein